MATSSKEQILASIRQHTTERFAMPNLSKLEHDAQTFANPIEAFSKALEQSGGHAEARSRCLLRWIFQDEDF